EHCILVGIVSGAGANQLGHQRRFTTVTATRNNDRLPFPTNDPGMNEDAMLCQFGHKDSEIRLECFKQAFDIKGTKQALLIAVKRIQTTHPGARSVSANQD